MGIDLKVSQFLANGQPTLASIPNTYLPPFTGSVVTSIAAKLAQTVSVLDFGADPTGVADSTAAIQAAINAAQVLQTYVQLSPGGKFRLNSGLTFKQGKAASGDPFNYQALLIGNQATLFPAAGVTAISVVPRCLLANAGTGAGIGMIDFSDFVIDGGVAGVTGANACLIGAAGFKTDAFAESGFTNVTIQNFQAQTTVNGGFSIIEARHISFKRFITRGNATVALISQTAGSFCGDVSFDAGSDLQGSGITGRPLYLAASNGGQVRGVKFAGDIYGPGTYLFSTGASSQVGDVWFSPGTQFDGIAADTASFLEMYATLSGQLFNVQASNGYFEAVNEIQAVYLHADAGGTTVGIDISGNWVGGMNTSLSLGAAAILVSGCTGFNINGNKFDSIIGTGGSNPAYIKITNACANFQALGNNATNHTGITYGVYLDASAHSRYSIGGNQLNCATSVLSENTLNLPAVSRQVWNNLLVGSGVSTQFGNVLRLLATAIPFIIAPTGTMANNGAITLGTALPSTYPNCFMYLPTGAIAAASAAGWYYTVMSSATAGVVNNNVYIPGTTGAPTIPAAPTPFVTTGPGAYTGVITVQAAQSTTVAANLMGPNGTLRYSALFTMPNNANVKTIAVAYGGIAFVSIGETTVVFASLKRSLQNRGVTNSQVSDGAGGILGPNTGAATPSYTAIDTTQNQQFDTTMQLAVATDFLICESVLLEVLA